MTTTSEIARYLDAYLDVAAVRDAREALNGLQVENSGAVRRVAAAVDLCAATIAMAAAAGADLLLVHHGLFWGGLRPLVGPHGRRVRALVEHDIAVYAAHLPLDCHPEVGNNAVLARRLGIQVRGMFGEYEGRDIGVWGELAVDRDELARRMAEVLGSAAPQLLAFGPQRTSRVGIITGSGGVAIAQAATAGLDTYLTGEGQHWTYFDAEELGINVLFAGHYATETVGVQALAEHVSQRFGVPWVFLDHPTGM
jgi:dinuclear metal center YbgI/SA1388 family protein